MPDDEVQAGGNVATPTLVGARILFPVVTLVGAYVTVATARDLGLADPVGTLGILTLVAIVPLLSLAALAKLEVEHRKPPPRYRFAPEGLVRIRGDEVRTIPWGAFVDATPIATSKRRGNVQLRSTAFAGRRDLWLDAREGRVWTFVNGLVLVDVEDPHAVAERLRTFLRR